MPCCTIIRIPGTTGWGSCDQSDVAFGGSKPVGNPLVGSEDAVEGVDCDQIIDAWHIQTNAQDAALVAECQIGISLPVISRVRIPTLKKWGLPVCRLVRDYMTKKLKPIIPLKASILSGHFGQSQRDPRVAPFFVGCFDTALPVYAGNEITQGQWKAVLVCKLIDKPYGVGRTPEWGRLCVSRDSLTHCIELPQHQVFEDRSSSSGR